MFAWGLLPLRGLNARITLPSDFSPSGFGVRKLTTQELSDIWNTPILLQDAFVRAGRAADLANFTTGVPAKVLMAATDFLLSSLFRGVGFFRWTFYHRGSFYTNGDSPSLNGERDQVQSFTSSADPNASINLHSTGSHTGQTFTSSADLNASINFVSTRVPTGQISTTSADPNYDASADQSATSRTAGAHPNPPQCEGPDHDVKPTHAPMVEELGGGKYEWVKGVEVDLTSLESKIIKQEGQKADDAEVPVRMWEDMFLETMPENFPPLHPLWRERLESYRTLGLSYWRQCLLRSFWWDVGWRLPAKIWKLQPSVKKTVRWLLESEKRYVWIQQGKQRYQTWAKAMKAHPAAAKDWEPAIECMEKAAGATWWEWKEGSRLFFWNWPPSYRTWARDGQAHYQTKELPTFTKPQKPPKTEHDRLLCWKKLFPVRKRKYIAAGKVTSLMHMFYVPKGDTDIRMVYNGTASGINECLFAPHFSLPTISQVLRALWPGYHQADLNIGEMFLNFMLGEEIRAYSGVDVTHVKTCKTDLPHHQPDPLTEMQDWRLERTRAWEHWERNWMGLTDSPFRSAQMMMVAKEKALGSHTDERNPFRWTVVVLNLPGNKLYDPTMPWVYKRRANGQIASGAFVYVDENKTTGSEAHYQTKELPTFTKPQKPPKTEHDRLLCWKKLFPVRKRKYIAAGKVTSLMHMFYVPKGDTDIRMVYNGTASGINECLFAPHFSLPTVSQVLRALGLGYHQADLLR